MKLHFEYNYLTSQFIFYDIIDNMRNELVTDKMGTTVIQGIYDQLVIPIRSIRVLTRVFINNENRTGYETEKNFYAITPQKREDGFVS